MLRRSATRISLLSFLGVVACHNADAGAGPQLPPCTAAGLAITLSAAGQYTSVDPGPASGCVAFPANTSGTTAEYLIVPQLATGDPGTTSSFQLLGDTILQALPSPPAPAPSAVGLPALAPAEQFHTFLRLGGGRRGERRQDRITQQLKA